MLTLWSDILLLLEKKINTDNFFYPILADRQSDHLFKTFPSFFLISVLGINK